MPIIPSLSFYPVSCRKILNVYKLYESSGVSIRGLESTLLKVGPIGKEAQRTLEEPDLEGDAIRKTVQTDYIRFLDRK